MAEPTASTARSDVPPVVVRRLHPGDDPQALRALRLEMLADTPMAFIERVTDAQRHPPAYWIERMQRYTTDPSRVTYVAEQGQRWVGQAGAYVDPAGIAHLVSVYVAPARRGRGLLERLSGAVFDWAGQRGCTQVHLEVARENTRAVAAYRRLGFIATGRSQPHPLFPQTVTEIEMGRPL